MCRNYLNGFSSHNNNICISSRNRRESIESLLGVGHHSYSLLEGDRAFQFCGLGDKAEHPGCPSFIQGILCWPNPETYDFFSSKFFLSLLRARQDKRCHLAQQGPCLHRLFPPVRLWQCAGSSCPPSPSETTASEIYFVELVKEDGTLGFSVTVLFLREFEK